MLKLVACIAGILLILVVAELLWRRKILLGEYHRKFVHISTGLFVAFWPWLISWRAIQLIAIAMTLVILIDHRYKLFHFDSGIHRRTYGNLVFAPSVLICALLTNSKVFFAIAILQMALADGLAAVIGHGFLKHWSYKVFGEIKTVVGSMTFWLASMYILGAGLLLAHDQISFNHYVLVTLLLPPLLTLIENASPIGLDNLSVPLTTLLVLHLVDKA